MPNNPNKPGQARRLGYINANRMPYPFPPMFPWMMPPGNACPPVRNNGQTGRRDQRNGPKQNSQSTPKPKKEPKTDAPQVIMTAAGSNVAVELTPISVESDYFKRASDSKKLVVASGHEMQGVISTMTTRAQADLKAEGVMGKGRTAAFNTADDYINSVRQSDKLPKAQDGSPVIRVFGSGAELNTKDWGENSMAKFKVAVANRP